MRTLHQKTIKKTEKKKLCRRRDKKVRKGANAIMRAGAPFTLAVPKKTDDVPCGYANAFSNRTRQLRGRR